MATYQVMFWHDIPVQVRARGDGGRASVPLPPRFQEAIDQAAMSAGLIGSDAYSDTFRWSEPQERSGTAKQVAAAVAAELDAHYAHLDWQATAQALKTASQ